MGARTGSEYMERLGASAPTVQIHGETVTSGQPLVVIESMKMQNEFVAWRDGVVDRIHIAVGETFDRGAGLVGLAPEEVH